MCGASKAKYLGNVSKNVSVFTKEDCVLFTSLIKGLSGRATLAFLLLMRNNPFANKKKREEISKGKILMCLIFFSCHTVTGKFVTRDI